MLSMEDWLTELASVFDLSRPGAMALVERNADCFQKFFAKRGTFKHLHQEAQARNQRELASELHRLRITLAKQYKALRRYQQYRRLVRMGKRKSPTQKVKIEPMGDGRQVWDVAFPYQAWLTLHNPAEAAHWRPMLEACVAISMHVARDYLCYYLRRSFRYHYRCVRSLVVGHPRVYRAKMRHVPFLMQLLKLRKQLRIRKDVVDQAISAIGKFHRLYEQCPDLYDLLPLIHDIEAEGEETWTWAPTYCETCEAHDNDYFVSGDIDEGSMEEEGAVAFDWNAEIPDIPDQIELDWPMEPLPCQWVQ